MNRYVPLIQARVRTLKERRGLSLRALASLCGISSVHVHHILHGSRNPSFEVLCALERALGAPILTTAGRYEKRLKPRVLKEKKGKASKVKAVVPSVDIDSLSSED